MGRHKAKFKKDAYEIGTNVMVWSIVVPEYHRKSLGSASERELMERKLTEPRVGKIVGYRYLTVGKKHHEQEVGMVFEPTEKAKHGVWLVTFGYANKPVYVREESIDLVYISDPQYLPFMARKAVVQ
jgi:hypothetical protein